MEINSQILVILKEYYDIEASFIVQLTGGWSALAFLIEDKSKKYFLKAFDKKRPAVAQWIGTIDRYIPLVKWLRDNTILSNHIVSPIFTKKNSSKCEDEQYVYLLSEYIEGTTIGESALSYNQINELAKIIGVLHHSTSSLPRDLTEQQTKENFDIEYCDYLLSFLYKDLYTKEDILLQIVKPYTNDLLHNIDRMRILSNSLKHKPLQFVLCHADAHNWNIVQGQNMMLVDWECLRIAPPEQDLILNITEPYAAQFLLEYKKYMNYDKPDLDAFEFYFLKRKLEDIREWIKQLRDEDLVKSEDSTVELLRRTLKECTSTRSFRSNMESFLF